MSVCEELLVPFYVFVFYHFPSEGQGSLVSVLIIFISTLDPCHINTLR